MKHAVAESEIFAPLFPAPSHPRLVLALPVDAITACFYEVIG